MAKLFVITGPSGVGKGTLLAQLLKHFPDVVYSVSSTTRKPRAGEKDGVNYFFVSEEEFKNSVKNDEFIEWANYSGNFYGTGKKFVEEMLKSGKSVILEIETQGAMQVLSKEKECVSIFILPPSREELEKRLRGRNTESEEAVQKRLDIVAQEIALKDKYRYTVVNENIEDALNDLIKIFHKELKC